MMMKGLSALLASLLYSTSAIAQVPAQTPADAPEPAKDVGITDIIVTAQKGARGESVQKVPVSITAVDSSLIKSAQLTNISEVGHLSPSTQLDQPAVPGFSNFFIRGIGLNGSVRTIDPAVSVVVDGMPLEFMLGTVLDTNDAQGIEILRGPQGILFGRNATGGAISFTTRRPTNELEIEARVRIGNAGRFDQSFLIAGPIVKDQLLAKLSVSHQKSNGLYRDRNRGTFVPAPLNPSGVDNSWTGRQIGEDSWAIRPTIELRPSERFTVTLLGEYLNDQGGGAAARVINDVPNLATYFGYTPPKGGDEINHDIEGTHKLTGYRGIIDMRLETDVGVITSISGYRKIGYDITADIDGTPFTFFHFPKGNRDDSEQLSQELRFASNFSDVISFVVGGYYSDLQIDGVERRILSSFLGGTTYTPRALRGEWRQDGTTKALFYNVDYRPIPEIRLSHGGRYTEDEKDFAIIPLAPCTGSDFTGCGSKFTSYQAKWHNFSPKFGIEYQFADQSMVYASWTKGYRSGNFNSRANNLAAVGPANPETIKQIEAGVKTTFWDGKARVNLSVYTSKYNDIQRTVVVNAVQTLANAATATIKGVELETTFRPIEGLVLNGNLGYIDARYKEFFGLDVNGGGYDPNVDPDLAKNLDLDRVPKWTAFGQIAYTFQVPGFDPEFTARGSYAYTSHFFGDALNEVKQPSFGLLDATFTVRNDNWSVSLYGKNLTNKFHNGQASRFNFGPGPGGVAYVAWGTSMREYGVELAYTF
jgi:iron complex outermembrane receptor protein